MSSNIHRIYWDSCCVISYLSGEVGRVDTLEAILDEVHKSDGGRKIITSEISKVEVAFLATEKQQLDPDAENRIDEFWRDDSVIELLEMGEHIASLSRQIIRRAIADGKKCPKPNDAIHLATAKYAQVNEFHTYDLSDFASYDGAFGFSVSAPFAAQGRIF